MLDGSATFDKNASVNAPRLHIESASHLRRQWAHGMRTTWGGIVGIACAMERNGSWGFGLDVPSSIIWATRSKFRFDLFISALIGAILSCLW